MSDFMVKSTDRDTSDRESVALELDERIRTEISRLSNGDIRKSIERAEIDVKLWAVAGVIVETEDLAALDNDTVAGLVGDNDGPKLIAFLSTMSQTQARDTVKHRLEDAINKLDIVAPGRSGVVVDRARTSISSLSDDPGN